MPKAGIGPTNAAAGPRGTCDNGSARRRCGPWQGRTAARGFPRLEMDARKAAALFQQSLSLPTAFAKGRAVSREPARCFVTDLRLRGRAAPAAAGYVLPPACRVSPRCGVFLRLALRRNQRSSEMRRRCSQIGEPRCAVFAPCSMAGLNRAGNRLNARMPSVLADEILFDQKSVTDRRSTRPNAPVGSVPAGDIAVRATRCSIFRASNRPLAQVK